MTTKTELRYALDRAEALAVEQAQEAGRLRALCERYREQLTHAEKAVSEENERLEAALEDAQAKVEELKQAARLKVALEVQEFDLIPEGYPNLYA